MFRKRRRDAGSRSRLRRARETGQGVVEFALVATAFLMFVFGILDCARLFESWTAVQHAAREGARMAVTGQTTCTINGTAYNTRQNCIVNTVKNSTTGLLGGGINSAAASLTIECQSWDYPTYATASGSGTCSDSAGTGYKADSATPWRSRSSITTNS